MPGRPTLVHRWHCGPILPAGDHMLTLLSLFSVIDQNDVGSTTNSNVGIVHSSLVLTGIWGHESTILHWNVGRSLDISVNSVFADVSRLLYFSQYISNK